MAAPPRRSLATSLAQHLGGGAAVVALAAGAFYGIGLADGGEPATSVRDEDPSETQPPDEDDEDDPDEPAPEPDDPPEPEDPVDDDDGDDADGDGADETSDDDTADAADDDGTDDDGDRDAETSDDDTADAADDDGTDDGPDEEQAAPPALQPAEVTVQVLDGYQDDGGAAAGQVADQLVAAGYDLIAQNPALRRDETTVFYTEGNEPAARQVADELGVGRVEAQPGNLSTSVHVHVVTGSDRG